MRQQQNAEVIIVGGGIAGLSAAIYLGRAERDTLVIDTGKSMARWEPDVQNYLGFPEGVGGGELVERGREQSQSFDVRFVNDNVVKARIKGHLFVLEGRAASYQSKRLLLATGI